MTTTTLKDTIKSQLDNGNLNEVGTALKQMKFGTMMGIIKKTLTSLTAAGTHDLTDAAHGSGPAVGKLVSLRVTAATTASTAGTYILTDIAGDMITAATHTVVGVARISDDGTQISFPTADVTAFIIEYYPREAVATSTALPYDGSAGNGV